MEASGEVCEESRLLRISGVKERLSSEFPESHYCLPNIPDREPEKPRIWNHQQAQTNVCSEESLLSLEQCTRKRVD